MDHRGIDTVLKDMRQHPEDAKVQEKGCNALIRLAANKADREKIGAGGGVEAIVQAMGGHRGSVKIQEWSCWALLNLAEGPNDIQQRIKRAGAEEAVQRAMASPDATAVTKKKGQKLLSVLRNV